MASHLMEVFDKQFFAKLSEDFATMPFVNSGADENTEPTRHIDYSYVSVFGKRFTLEIFDDEVDGEDENPESH
jgi:hypothetical protein